MIGTSNFTKQRLYGHLLTISETMQILQIRHAVQCWRSKGEILIDILLGTPTHRRARVGRPTRTSTTALCRCRYGQRDLPETMDDRKGRRVSKREKERGGESMIEVKLYGINIYIYMCVCVCVRFPSCRRLSVYFMLKSVKRIYV